MPTRKQRRKEQKSRRHEYEYVYVDEEGNEVDVDPEDVKPQKLAARDSAKSRNGKAPAARGPQGSRRVPPMPSWPRAAKRAAILGVFFVIVFGFLLRGKNSNPSGAVLIGVVYAVAFIPLQYFIDRTVYRAYLRRQGASGKKT
jgi:hypothetical protein